MYVSVMQVFMMDVSMMHVYMHASCIHDACIHDAYVHDACINDACIHEHMYPWCMYPWCMYPWCMYLGCMYPWCMYPLCTYPRSLNLMHVSIMQQILLRTDKQSDSRSWMTAGGLFLWPIAQHQLMHQWKYISRSTNFVWDYLNIQQKLNEWHFGIKYVISSSINHRSC